MQPRGQRSRATVPITAGLLALQVVAGGAMPLAHAGERQTAPSGIEAHHDVSCVVIHDAMRCALCQFAGSLGAPPATPEVAASTGIPAQPAGLTATLGMGSAKYIASRPRAPPSHLS